MDLESITAIAQPFIPGILAPSQYELATTPTTRSPRPNFLCIMFALIPVILHDREQLELTVVIHIDAIPS